MTIKQPNTVCLFYVAERLKDLKKIKSEKQLRYATSEFLDEVIYNIGVNSIIDNCIEDEEKDVYTKH